MDDVALAASLVRDAGSLAARMRTGDLEVEQKTSVSDLVSAADKAAERLIASRLAEQRPGDGVVGEEGTRRTEDSQRVWYVDPVDGTYNFVHELPVWCSAVALRDGEDGLGAIYQPAVDELWVGGTAHPTSRNGRVVPTLTDQPVSSIAVATYLHPTTLPDDRVREPLLRVMRAAATVRMLGSGSVELASVASGRLGAWVHYSAPPWDWWPGAALVRAAGGAAETVHAEGVDWYVAGSRRAVDDLLALVSH